MHTFNGQISYAQTMCNICIISEHMQVSTGNFVNESRNVPRKGVVLGFSDLEIMAFEYDIRSCWH